MTGLLCGGLVGTWTELAVPHTLTSPGYLIYRTGSSATLHWFLVGSTSILFLIGAGLASKAVGYFQYYQFAKGVRSDVAEAGDGTGSFMVKGNVWHLTYGNPEVSLLAFEGCITLISRLDFFAHDEWRLSTFQRFTRYVLSFPRTNLPGNTTDYTSD